MNARQNLLKVLHHEDPEWVPVFPLIGGYNVPGRVPRHLVAPKCDALGIIRWLGGDVLHRCHAVREVRSPSIRTSTASSDGVATTTIETPAGRLVSRRKDSKIRWEARDEEVEGEDILAAGEIETSYLV